MKISFEAFEELLNEGFTIDGNKVSFDPKNDDFIRTKFGKTKGLKPYEGSLPFGKYYAAYSSNNKSDADAYKEILKAIKGKSDSLEMDPESYDKFLERTAIYLAKYILENKIDTILILETSSPLLYDLVGRIGKKIPKYFDTRTYSKSIFKNPDLSKIRMDKDKYGIDDATMRNLNKTFDKLRETGYFKISAFPNKFRNIFRDWLMVNDSILSKIVDKNVCVIDDYVTTASTLKEASQLLQDAGAKSVLGLAILKG